MAAPLTSQTVDLLQQLIRNRCVNDGTPGSGEEVRNSDLLQTFLEGSGLDVERFDATDVVPVNEAGWTRDPFGGELVDGEVWGRGAVDMLNLTASMAVAFRHLADGGFRPRGDLIYFAVADEESGSAYGARWMADHARDAIQADYVLTEAGGLHSGPKDQPTIGINVGEKGVAWRTLRIKGTPGHGSRPYKSDNALVTAAAVISRIADYRPAPASTTLGRRRWTA